MKKILSLEKILQQQGFGTRKECKYLIYHQRVLVNNILCDNPYAEFEVQNLQNPLIYLIISELRTVSNFSRRHIN